jgi:hypothetical protein
MKKNLKLLVSSALVALTFAEPQKIWGMETPTGQENPTPSRSHSTHTNRDSLTNFIFRDSSLYHQASTLQYRTQVKILRQSILETLAKLPVSGTNSCLNNKRREIADLENKLSLRREALQDYGKGQDIKSAKEDILSKISETKMYKEKAEQNKATEPNDKEIYDRKIKKANDSLESYQKYLSALDEIESDLQRDLEVNKDCLKDLEQQSSSSADNKEVVQKIEEANALYKSHVKGLCSEDIFPDNFPKTILKNWGIPAAQLNNVAINKLFALFARTMEMPYVAYQTGEDLQEVYKNQLKVVKQNLTNRIKEDVLAFQLLSSTEIAQNGKICLNFGGQDKLLRNIAEESKDIETSSEHTIANDLETFKEILSPYGYQEQKPSSKGFLSYSNQEQKPSSLLETVIRQSPYGLLGLCITALESYPVTSWNDIAKPSFQTRMKDIKTSKEFSAGVIENVYSILGRHINKLILQNIEDVLEGSMNSPSSSFMGTF